jgi:hypothetical protein
LKICQAIELTFAKFWAFVGLFEISFQDHVSGGTKMPMAQALSKPSTRRTRHPIGPTSARISWFRGISTLMVSPPFVAYHFATCGKNGER